MPVEALRLDINQQLADAAERQWKYPGMTLSSSETVTARAVPPNPLPPTREKVDLFPYALMAPGLILVLFVTLYPILFAVDYSLMKTQVFKQLSFVGLSNYIRLLSSARFQENLLNSFLFVGGSVVLTWVLGLALALFLRQQSWGNTVLKTI